MNQGAGSFGPASSLAAGPRPSSVASADFDGDGWPDLVVVDNSESNIRVLRGGPGGTLAAPVVIGALGVRSFAVTTGDFDGDGRPDVMAADEDGNAIYFLRNTSR
jgi:hypothetical protein